MPVPGRVSVIVLCYDQQAFIGDAIESVLAQTHPDVEIVVADDGSTDGSVEIIRELAARHPAIVPVLSPRNTGISGNLNRGLARCTGEFLAQLDGDDVMLPGKLERQVAFLRAHPEHAVCNHDVEVFDSRTGEVLYRWSDRHGTQGGGPELELNTNYTFGRAPKTIPSAALMRASAVPAHGWDERLRWANDWLFGIEVLRHGTRGFVPEVLGRYRRHDGNISSGAAGLDSFEELMMVLAIVETRYPELAPRARRTRNFLLFRHALYAWDEPALRADRERQFRDAAGVLPWLYLKGARQLLGSPSLLAVSRPVRTRVKRALSGELAPTS